MGIPARDRHQNWLKKATGQAGPKTPSGRKGKGEDSGSRLWGRSRCTLGSGRKLGGSRNSGVVGEKGKRTRRGVGGGCFSEASTSKNKRGVTDRTLTSVGGA